MVVALYLRFVEVVEELELRLTHEKRLQFFYLDHLVDDMLDVHVLLNLGDGFV
jgi:hypothetical protein